MAVAVVVILAVAQLSWTLLESKMLRIGQQFGYRYAELEAAPMAVTAHAPAA